MPRERKPSVRKQPIRAYDTVKKPPGSSVIFTNDIRKNQSVRKKQGKGK